jgi:Ca2+-dependent lipid-binding protein
MLGTIDLFYQLDFSGKRWKSNIVTMKDDVCVHNYEFWVPLSCPLASDRLVIKLFDYDMGKSDEIVGSLVFSLKKLVSKGSNGGFYSWYNVYGSPLGTVGESTN